MNYRLYIKMFVAIGGWGLDMEIVNNLRDKNHLLCIKDELKKATKLLLVSPYLYEDFDSFCAVGEVDNINEIELITSLSTSTEDELKKPKSLLSFLKLFNRSKAQIHINNKVHAKIYLFADNSGWFSGIITSANLTKNGMTQSHEWGVKLDCKKTLGSLYDDLISNLDYKNVPHQVIAAKLLPAAEQLEKELNTSPKIPNAQGELLGLLSKQASDDNIEFTGNYYLKPYGHQGHPLEPEKREDFSERNQLSFPNPRPKSITRGDVVITFGVGCQYIVSVNVVLSNVTEIDKRLQKINPDYERWRWTVNSHILSKSFSKSWWSHKLNFREITKDFNVGKTDPVNLGGFNRGRGFLQIPEELAFAMFKHILDCENEPDLEKLLEASPHD